MNPVRNRLRNKNMLETKNLIKGTDQVRNFHEYLVISIIIAEGGFAVTPYLKFTSAEFLTG